MFPSRVCVLQRKLSLVGLAIPFVSGSVSQAYFVGFLSIGWLTVHCWIQPYTHSEDNVLKAYCDFVVLCSAMTALAKDNGSVDNAIDNSSFQHALYSNTLFVVMVGLVPVGACTLAVKCLRVAWRYEHTSTSQKMPWTEERDCCHF